MKSNNNRNAAPKAPREVLVVEGIQKTYGNRRALKGLTFTLLAGRVMGFLGPNGAGKTTSIRILTTIMEPDAGHFMVDGIKFDQPEKIRRKIGVLPENLGFPRQMTAVEYLVYFGQLYGLPPQSAKTNALRMLNEVGLENRTKSLISSFSHGMRQRLGIARALVNDPVVVFLDEPTLGLDPRGQQELLLLIQRIAREHQTGVILCSHMLSEIEGICDDVIILSSGQVVAQGAVNSVIGTIQRNVARVRVPPENMDTSLELLSAMPNVFKVSFDPQMRGWLSVELADFIEVDSQSGNLRNAILKALIQSEIPVLSYEAEGGRLQDVFLQLTEEVIK